MAAINLTFLYKGLSGRVYSIDAYAPDAVATQVTFNGSGLAGASSNDYWKVPEAGFIIDNSANGAPTAVGAIVQQDGAEFTNACIRWANQSNALATRPPLAIPIRAGVQLGLKQF